MTKKLKRLVVRVLVSFALFLLSLVLPEYEFILCTVAYIIMGYDVIKEAFFNILSGSFMDENFLMLIATFGAFFTREYPEAFMVMWLYQIGEGFQTYAVNKSRGSISTLMSIVPDFANLVKGDSYEEVDPYDVEIGDIIQVNPGEKIPLDGIVIEGNSMIDTSALTGESVPRRVKKDDEILSGTINLNSVIKIEVTKEFDDSAVSKILELVENASERKAKAENFISKFAKYYTPTVVYLALALAVIPPLVIPGATFSDYIYRACAFLVVSCPCALVISVPLSFFGGIGGASKNGILVKGSNYLETLAEAKTIVFDKTGTLTKGVFKVQEVNTSIDKDKFLELASLAESYSNHPIALSIKESYGKELELSRVSNYEEIAGKGISLEIDGIKHYLGNDKLMESLGIPYEKLAKVGTVIYLASDKFLGSILISDELKDKTLDAVKKLSKECHTVMLTGDNLKVANDIKEKIGIDEVYGDLLPQDKLSKLEEIIAKSHDKVAYVGDGINDAPVLTRADVGISMGSLGSDAAIEASDIVIMDDDISKIDVAIRIARKTLKIVRENVIFAIGIKIIVLIMAAFNYAPLWLAIFADVGVAFICILNAMRTLRYRG